MSRFETLVNISRDKHIYAFNRFNWPEIISDEEWWVSPEQLSIFGTKYFDELSEQQKKILSKWECINLFSININGEREVLIRISELLTKPLSKNFNEYLHHFIDEENQHMWWFEEFCKRYAGKYYVAKNSAVQGLDIHESLAAIVTLARILIFEEIGHYYNVKLAKCNKIHPFIKEINEAHKNDEARHITFGRESLKILAAEVVQHTDTNSLKIVNKHLKGFLQITLESLYNPAMYRDANINIEGGALNLRNILLNDPFRKQFNENQLSGGIVKFLTELKLLEQ